VGLKTAGLLIGLVCFALKAGIAVVIPARGKVYQGRVEGRRGTV